MFGSGDTPIGDAMFNAGWLDGSGDVKVEKDGHESGDEKEFLDE